MMDFCALCVCQGNNNRDCAPRLIIFSGHNLLSKQFFILRALVKWTKKCKSAALQDQNFSVYPPFHASKANSSSSIISSILFSRLQLSLLRR